jgi:cell division FtsZ-interacting protein ZapD
MIDEDIKSIKRLNVVLSKMNRNDKDVNTLEAINILKILNNVLDISKMQLIFMELIDIDYHESVLYLISHINDLNVDKMKAVESEVQE